MSGKSCDLVPERNSPPPLSQGYFLVSCKPFLFAWQFGKLNSVLSVPTPHQRPRPGRVGHRRPPMGEAKFAFLNFKF